MLNSSFINICETNASVPARTKINPFSFKIIKNEHTESGYKFIINNIDIFTISDIIKYISSGVDDIIEKYICKKRNGFIILNTVENSALMGNLEILINIYNGLREFENNIENNIKNLYIKFIYAFLNHTLKIILHINEYIEDSKSSIKNKLLYLGVVITHQLLQYTREEFNTPDIKKELPLSVSKIENNYVSDDIG